MRSIELFAGAGGLALGLHKAGFEPSKVVEVDRWCCDTLQENFKTTFEASGTWDVFKGDARAVDYSEFEGRLDLVSGGPPCQPFSLGGRHKAHADARDMFPEAIRAVRETRPKAFVFENVKGLTRATFRNYFEYIKLQFEHPEIVASDGEDWADHLSRLEKHHTSNKRSGLHYKVVARLLNAADYGVPQCRERVFFVGFRDDLGVEWSFPDATHSRDALAWAQAKDKTYWERHQVERKGRAVEPRLQSRASKLTEKPSTQPWRTVRDAIIGLPDPELEPELSKRFQDHRFQSGARSYKGHTGSPLDLPSKTLKAGVHGVPGGENMLRRPDGSVRYFSVRESARIQTFPDTFRFHGAWSEIMRQLGNAVPMELAAVVGTHVAAELKHR